MEQELASSQAEKQAMTEETAPHRKKTTIKSKRNSKSLLSKVVGEFEEK